MGFRVPLTVRSLARLPAVYLRIKLEQVPPGRSVASES